MASPSFWRQLPRPLLCVAPMANVTDVAFRRVISDLAKPSVMWTEFVSCEALTHDADSRERMMGALQYAEQERPVVAQLFGSKPEQFFESAAIVRDLGFDGVDINMGCPEAVVNNQGAGAALMLQPSLAERIIAECKRGAGPLPVSVKTRVGFHRVEYRDWVLRLLGAGIEVLTVHGRTRDEMSKVPAHWDVIGDVAHLARAAGSDALVLGNGDVQTVAEARAKAARYGLDGIMLGRALLGNPWLFQGHTDTAHVSVRDKLEVVRRHTQYFDELLARPRRAGFVRMRKFYGSYLKGVPNARAVRERLAHVKTAEEAFAVLDGCLEHLERAGESDEGSLEGLG